MNHKFIILNINLKHFFHFFIHYLIDSTNFNKIIDSDNKIKGNPMVFN